jgi:hypothetical protein
VKAAQWASTDEVQKAAPKAKALNRERRVVMAAAYHASRGPVAAGSQLTLMI